MVGQGGLTLDSTFRPSSLGGPEDRDGQVKRRLGRSTLPGTSLVRALEALEQSNHPSRPPSIRRKAASHRRKATLPGLGPDRCRDIDNTAWLEGICATVLDRAWSDTPTGGAKEAARLLCEYGGQIPLVRTGVRRCLGGFDSVMRTDVADFQQEKEMG